MHRGLPTRGLGSGDSWRPWATSGAAPGEKAELEVSAMDWLTFLSSLTGSLAWPATAITVVLILRKPLRGLLPLVQKLSYKGLELEFGERVKEVRAQVARELPEAAGPAQRQSRDERALGALAAVSPRAAVLEAWREVELAALGAAQRLADEGFGPVPQTLTQQALAFLERSLDGTAVRLLRSLRALRNQAAHAPDFALSTDSALEYAASADAVARYLEGIGLEGKAGGAERVTQASE